MRLGVLAAVFALGASTAEAQGQPAHEYVIEATLDPETHTVEGTARILWTNESTEPAHELYLHLYLNAFESDETVFLRESGGSLRGDEFTGEGRIDLISLERVLPAGPVDLLAHADDALMEGDRTQLRVPLAEAVPPRGTLILTTRFESRLPPLFARSGYHGSFHMVAQWFPKLARRERDGTWATFPYHGHGEFYADFARYDLTVSTPSSFSVGATGTLQEERAVGGTVTRRFVADRVHDTAFAAWDHFVERTFEHEGVHVRILHPPGYEPAVERHAFITKRGLTHFGRLFGEYPYAALTVIVPPRAASGAAGMEYPMLFCTAGNWFAVPGLHIGEVEGTTAHELAHQWFQGMVATNEVKWPMLDEGLTNWATGELLAHLYGRERSGVDWGDIELDFFELMRVAALRGDPTPPPGTPAYAFERDSAYVRSVYARTSIVLETVRRVWGPARFDRALGIYAREHRFGHPEPEDLFDAFDRAYWRGFSAQILAPALLEGAEARIELLGLDTRREGDLWVSEIEAHRDTDIPVPTQVVLRNRDGVVARIDWPGDTARLVATHTGEHRADVAELDPSGKVLLDPDALDNVQRERGGPETDLFGRLLFLAQQVLGWVGP